MGSPTGSIMFLSFYVFRTPVSSKRCLSLLLDLMLERNAEYDMWLHLAAAHLRQFEYDDMLPRWNKLDVFVCLEVSQSEYDPNWDVDHQLRNLESQRFDVHVLVQESCERDSDRIHHRERGADDTEVAENIEFATQLHVDSDPAGVVQLMFRDEAANLAPPSTEQLDIVRAPLERFVHDEDDATDRECLKSKKRFIRIKPWTQEYS